MSPADWITPLSPWSLWVPLLLLLLIGLAAAYRNGGLGNP